MKIYNDGDIQAHISTDIYSNPVRYCAVLLGGEYANFHAYGKTPAESIKKLKNSRNFRRLWDKRLNKMSS